MSVQVQPFLYKSLKRADIEAEERARVAAELAVLQAEQGPVEPSFSEEELLAAQKEAQTLGFEQGKAEGRAEAEAERAEREKQMLALLQSMQGMMMQTAGEYQAQLDVDLRPFTAIVLEAARKYSNLALATHPHEAVLAMLQECRNLLIGAPKAALSVHPEMVEPLRERIGAAMGGVTVEVTGDPALEMGDCLLDWGSGKAKRSTEALWQEIEAILVRALDIR